MSSHAEMTDPGHEQAGGPAGDTAPGDPRKPAEHAVRNYVIGLVLAASLTAVSFWVARTPILWQPGVPLGLCVLALAQQGIHLVFFLHLTTGADNTNNSLAVAFGVLIILLIGAGTLWIMHNLDYNMMGGGSLMDLHTQH